MASLTVGGFSSKQRSSRRLVRALFVANNETVLRGEEDAGAFVADFQMHCYES